MVCLSHIQQHFLTNLKYAAEESEKEPMHCDQDEHCYQKCCIGLFLSRIDNLIIYLRKILFEAFLNFLL